MVDLEQSRTLASAVFAIHYHTESAARGLAHPDSLPDELRLADLPAASEALRTGLDQRHGHGLHAARLGISQLYRAHCRQREAGHDEIIDSLTGAFCGHAEGGVQSDEHQRRFGGLKTNVSQLRDGLRKAEHSPDQGFFHAFEQLRPPTLHPRELRRYSLSWSYRDQVTDVTANVEVKRPVGDFKQMLDPRNWHSQVPLVWDKSLPLSQAPRDRAQDGTVVESVGDAFRGLFYEQAVFAFGIARFATYRNLLDIDIDVGGPKRVGYNYRQHECLSTEFPWLGERVLGGIDADRGHAFCTKLDGNWSRLEGRKRARFDQPSGPLERVYNDLASVYLSLLIQALVLFGAEL